MFRYRVVSFLKELGIIMAVVVGWDLLVLAISLLFS